MNEKIKDIITRALWTFAEAFIAALSVSLPTMQDWKAPVVSALLAGIAAGLSAIKTTVVHSVNAGQEGPDGAVVAPTGRKVYLSPSGQYGNKYPVGDTDEGHQCERIAAACAKALEAHGIEVMNGAGKDYDTRIADATAFMPDLYMPIHTNAYDGKVSGTRMFVRSFSESASYDMCKKIFARLDAIMPGTSSNIKEYPALWEFNATKAFTAVYAECDFHDVLTVAQFIVDHAEEIGEEIAHGICDGFGIAYT